MRACDNLTNHYTLTKIEILTWRINWNFFFLVWIVGGCKVVDIDNFNNVIKFIDIVENNFSFTNFVTYIAIKAIPCGFILKRNLMQHSNKLLSPFQTQFCLRISKNPDFKFDATLFWVEKACQLSRLASCNK